MVYLVEFSDNVHKSKRLLPKDFVVFTEARRWVAGSSQLSWQALQELLGDAALVCIAEQPEYREMEKVRGRAHNIAASA